MLSMAVQPNLHASSSLKPLAFSSSNPSVTSIKPCVFTKPRSFSSHPVLNAAPQKFRLSAAAATAEESVDENTELDSVSAQNPPATQKLGVVVKPIDSPRLVLKFIWMEKNIGIALDQMIPGHGTIPLSPYYFWPRKDAWEELKELLESKPWISQKQMIILLNQATDIINLWQQSGGNLV
ncbi:30S ribosomal protein 3, chloroplastic [Neltuma alba]|uniref:30S ribosomal protein 3, chloroplastic n=1 Tax=Neltuma alba TaxID=207710 RepID=UPI0010A57490|nr:30S ribosomal protein 3, chloroplastic-like [Prosopis alba]